jgi:hypothetical protein
VRILGGQPDPTSPVQIAPSEAESLEYKDWAITGVMSYANQLKDADGYLYILDVQNLLTYQSGIKWEVRDGFSQTHPAGAYAGWGFGCMMLNQCEER